MVEGRLQRRRHHAAHVGHLLRAHCIHNHIVRNKHGLIENLVLKVHSANHVHLSILKWTSRFSFVLHEHELHITQYLLEHFLLLVKRQDFVSAFFGFNPIKSLVYGLVRDQNLVVTTGAAILVCQLLLNLTEALDLVLLDGKRLLQVLILLERVLVTL